MHNHWANIFGWCNFQNLYLDCVNKYDNTLFCEVGSFQGQSCCYLAELIKEKNKNIRIISVDLFPTHEEIEKLSQIGAGQSIEKDIIRALPDSLINTFVKNMRDAGVEDIITPIKSDSIKASKIFPDEHFSMVFLDDCHFHDYVLEELSAWWPKVKKGGMYMGHDVDDPGVGAAVREFAKKNSLKMRIDLASWVIEKE